jgi:5-methylcytosine-specific restriction protein A
MSPPSWRSTPLPKEWGGEIRPPILERDPTCRLRTHCRGAPSVEVDHMGAPDDHRPHMLQGVCHECHKHKTGRQGAAASWIVKNRRARGAPRHPGIVEG